VIREVKPNSFKGDNATMEDISYIPHFYLINREDCELFDTSYKVPLTKLPDKIVRKQRSVGYDENGNIEHEKINWI